MWSNVCNGWCSVYVLVSYAAYVRATMDMVARRTMRERRAVEATEAMSVWSSWGDGDAWCVVVGGVVRGAWWWWWWWWWW